MANGGLGVASRGIQRESEIASLHRCRRARLAQGWATELAGTAGTAGTRVNTLNQRVSVAPRRFVITKCRREFGKTPEGNTGAELQSEPCTETLNPESGAADGAQNPRAGRPRVPGVCGFDG